MGRIILIGSSNNKYDYRSSRNNKMGRKVCLLYYEIWRGIAATFCTFQPSSGTADNIFLGSSTVIGLKALHRSSLSALAHIPLLNACPAAHSSRLSSGLFSISNKYAFMPRVVMSKYPKASIFHALDFVGSVPNASGILDLNGSYPLVLLCRPSLP